MSTRRARAHDRNLRRLGAVCAHVHAPLAGRPRIKLASLYVTVHAKKWYKSAKKFSRFRRIPRCLPFSCTGSKFGADSPFHFGDIATFVPGGRTLENWETAIFIRTLRAEKCFRIRAPLHAERWHAPPQPLVRCRRTPTSVKTNVTGPTKVADRFLASLVNSSS